MLLLLTRPAREAARTRERLESLGHQVVVSPIMEIVGTGAAWPQGVIDAIVATSAQAFWVDIAGLLPEVRRVMPLYLVGARTEEAARAAGFRGPVVVEKQAAALATFFEELGATPQRLVYLAGRDRKPDLEAALEARGGHFDVVDVYEAKAVEDLTSQAVRALQQGRIGGALHYSRRSAALFLAAARHADLNVETIAHFCLSPDVAVPFQEAGCPQVRVAPKPSETELLGLLDLKR